MEEKNFDLLSQFNRFEWMLHRLHLKNHLNFGPMGDPRRGQGRVLGILKMQPEISQRDLSYLLDMRPQSLGELLAKLEKNGYITRTQSETDRRAQNIKLTPEGAAAAEKPESEFDADKLFDCLNEEEQNHLRDYLKRLIAALEAQLGDEPPMHDFAHCRPGSRFGEPGHGHHPRPGWGGPGGPRSEMIHSLHRHMHFDRYPDDCGEKNGNSSSDGCEGPSAPFKDKTD